MYFERLQTQCLIWDYALRCKLPHSPASLFAWCRDSMHPEIEFLCYPHAIEGGSISRSPWVTSGPALVNSRYGSIRLSLATSHSLLARLVRWICPLSRRKAARPFERFSRGRLCFYTSPVRVARIISSCYYGYTTSEDSPFQVGWIRNLGTSTLWKVRSLYG
jgi:hypothetical protein